MKESRGNSLNSFFNSKIGIAYTVQGKWTLLKLFQVDGCDMTKVYGTLKKKKILDPNHVKQ